MGQEAEKDNYHEIEYLLPGLVIQTLFERLSLYPHVESSGAGMAGLWCFGSPGGWSRAGSNAGCLEVCVLSPSLQGHHKAQPNLQHHPICCPMSHVPAMG